MSRATNIRTRGLLRRSLAMSAPDPPIRRPFGAQQPAQEVEGYRGRAVGAPARVRGLAEREAASQQQAGPLVVDRAGVGREDGACVPLREEVQERLGGGVPRGLVADPDLQLPPAQAGGDLEPRQVE